MTELLIKNIVAEILFGNKICESIENQDVVNYLYESLLLEKILYGEPITVPELRKLLHQKILNFEFIKLDGTIRPARGTTMMKYVPQSAHPKGIRPSSPKVAAFYDLQKKDWRSVSQRSKEIVLKQDEKTGKPVIMVKDKPEGKEIPAGQTMDINIGDVFDFSKWANVKYQSGDKKKFTVGTWITITRETEEGFWGITAGTHKLDILLTPERLERLGEKMEVGDEYQFIKLDPEGKRIFTTIKITRKSDEGFWGKTPDSNKEILLTNERLKRVHKYEQPEITVDGKPTGGEGPKVTEPGAPVSPEEKPEAVPEPGEDEPIKPTVSKVKPVEKTAISKKYHFKNPKTGALEVQELTPKEVIKKLKELGKGWMLQTADEFASDETDLTRFGSKVPGSPEPEVPIEEPKSKPIIKKGQNLQNLDANAL